MQEQGSSPQARGALEGAVEGGFTTGLIPAGAGSSCMAWGIKRASSKLGSD